MSQFKPLLASPVDFKLLDYTNLWASPKLDGIRAIVMNSVVLSRKLIPIPNAEVQRLFGRPEMNGFDGELIVGEAHSETVYNDTFSGVMKKDGKPEVTFYAFDHVGDPTLEYQRRYDILREWPGSGVAPVVRVRQLPIENHESLRFFEHEILDDGFEGVMLRAFHGPRSRYKFGRSTPKEGTLLKLKRFEDAEAEIIGWEEEMANNNAPLVDAFGNMKRSTHQENKSGKGRLGALICRTPAGVTFNIGTGYTAKMREDMWATRQSLVGKLAKYKHFAIGVVEAPRFPVFLGLRDPIDS